MKKRFLFLLALLLCFGFQVASAASLDLPGDVQIIEDEAFLGDLSLSQVVLPEGCTQIGKKAFADSGLKQIALPWSLSSIADDAFDGCADFTATVYENSYAHQFCREHNVSYTLISNSRVYYDTRNRSQEIELFNIHMSESTTELNVLSNCEDGMLTNDTNGALKGALAREWGSPDGGLTWVFTLRDGITWVDYKGKYKADVKASDFATGLEWVLNYAKNDSCNISMPMDMIAGAETYYDYTKELTESSGYDAACALTASGAFAQMVGISFDDAAGTVTYKLTSALPYFPTAMTYGAFYPLSQAYLNEVGVEGYWSASYDTIWYNGPYTITSFDSGNKKTLTKNKSYYAPEVERFDLVVISMVDGSDEAYNLFDSGLADQLSLSTEKAQEIYSNSDHPYHSLLALDSSIYSYQMHFNYDKRISLDDQSEDVAWNTAVANEHFRLALYHGIDLTDYLAQINPITPLVCQNYTYTGKNVAVTSDGRDYTELVMEKLGITYGEDHYSRYNAETARRHADQAKSELQAAGIELPVHAAYYIIKNSSSAAETAQALKNCMENLLGDLVVLDIRTYEGSQAREVRTPRLYSFIINGWGADFGDPVNFLVQETSGSDVAYYTNNYSHANDSKDPKLHAVYDEYSALVAEASMITDDMDKRYAAFAEAEAFLVEHALVVPMYYNTSWLLSRVDPASKTHVAYGTQDSRYVNWKKTDTHLIQ